MKRVHSRHRGAEGTRGQYNDLPMAEVQMLTVEPDSVDGSGFCGNSMVL